MSTIYVRSKLLLVGLLLAALAVTVMGCGAFGGQGGNYPERDVTFVVPYKPGGGFDLESRLLAPVLAKYLPNKVNVVVENESGGGGKMGTDKIMNSKADGYIIGIQDPIALGVLLARKELGALTADDIVPLARLDLVPSVIIAGANSKIKSANDMKGAQFRFGGGGDDDILVSKLLTQAYGASHNLVTFDGLAETSLAVARGDVDVAIGPSNSIGKQLSSLQGKIKPILIVGLEKSPPEYPDVPTAKSLGLKLDEAVYVNSKIVVATPKTPENVRKILADALEKATKDAEWIAAMTKAGFTPSPLLGPELQTYVKTAFAAVKQYEAMLPK